MKLVAGCVWVAVTVVAAWGGVPLVPYVGGRVVTSTAGGQTVYTYQWPGVYFDAHFTGDSVDVKVDDDQDNLWLWVDGVHKLTLTRPGRTTVSLKDLGPGPHDVRLEKASETQSSVGHFDGFYVPAAEDVLPPPHYDRRIEFIGDSYTVGYGDEARGQSCTVDDVRDTTDTSEAFGPLTAKHFHAAYRINAYSGRGAVRNYDGIAPGEPLPVLYNYTLFDKSVPADDAGWMPDVIVVGLGTNDFSTPLNPGEKWKTHEDLRVDFVNAYADFLEKLHRKWPAAHLIVMASTSFDYEIADAANATVNRLHADGIDNVESVIFSGLEWSACQGHPSLKDHELLSQILIDRIAALPKFSPKPATIAAAPETP